MSPIIENGNPVNKETKKKTLILRPGQLTLADLRAVYENPIKLILHESASDQIQKSSDCVNRIVKDNRTNYGINTGIGKLASTKISKEDLQTLQRAIVTSHVVGIGPDADDATVRLIMVLKINSLSRGFSGIRQKVIDALVALVNAEVYPQIPVKGSVGASGDLAPLAHMSVVLLGEGKARCQGKWLGAPEALAKAGLDPMALAPKEGVALINGAQVSAAFALRGLFAAEDVFVAALVCGSLSVEAGLGSRKAFDERIHVIRGQPGQIDAAAAYRDLLDSRSEISDSHQNCVKVQDPYSFRCQPQVMGACLTQIRNAAEVLRIEANAVTDNPLIFHEQDEAISGGNFHAEPSAMAADNLALAFTEIASISERRIALLMDHNMSQLPGFLVNKSGLFSGFMTAHVTAAALVRENKCLSHPACVDSIPTSGNQEDHVSMAPAAGRRLWEMAENVWGVLAIEWLSACQGLDFRVGLRSSAKLESARAVLREKVSFYEDDRIFAPDIDEALKLLKGGCLKRIVDTSFLPSM